MARRSLEGSRVLLTGASSGIGRALADQLAAAGARLLVTARRADRLAEIADRIATQGGECHVVAGDIADPAVRGRLAEQVTELWGGLDVLVNNAGVGAVGPFAEATPARLRTVMEVNFFAPLELTRLAIPLLRSGRRAIIVNIGSVLGHRAVPDKSEYCASKFALHGFSDALRAEVRELGIDLLLVSPSTTASEFFDQVIESAGDSKSLGKPMPAEEVARQTLRAMRRGRHEIILTARGRLLVWLDRLAPTWADRLMSRYGR